MFCSIIACLFLFVLPCSPYTSRFKLSLSGRSISIDFFSVDCCPMLSAVLYSTYCNGAISQLIQRVQKVVRIFTRSPDVSRFTVEQGLCLCFIKIVLVTEYKESRTVEDLPCLAYKDQLWPSLSARQSSSPASEVSDPHPQWLVMATFTWNYFRKSFICKGKLRLMERFGTILLILPLLYSSISLKPFWFLKSALLFSC